MLEYNQYTISAVPLSLIAVYAIKRLFFKDMAIRLNNLDMNIRLNNIDIRIKKLKRKF